ncbi:MAG: tautomerase family protein [Kiloniellales bacterium]|nr:tautomerase family protein [Kiloniellales bacterium]
MAQVKVYGRRDHLSAVRGALSDIIHAANRDMLGLPADKRFHRFIALEAEDLVYPPDRGPAYTIIEISMFEGRDPATKKALLKRLMSDIAEGLGIPVADIEITIFETPRANWGIRGKTGDELELSYKVEV